MDMRTADILLSTCSTRRKNLILVRLFLREVRMKAINQLGIQGQTDNLSTKSDSIPKRTKIIHESLLLLQKKSKWKDDDDEYKKYLTVSFNKKATHKKSRIKHSTRAETFFASPNEWMEIKCPRAPRQHSADLFINFFFHFFFKFPFLRQDLYYWLRFCRSESQCRG